MFLYDLGDLFANPLEVVEEGNATSEGKRKVVGVMQMDSARFADTAGWGFEGFKGGDANVKVVGKDYKEACYAGHVTVKDSDYVFSAWRQ